MGRDLVDVGEYAKAIDLTLRRNERLGTATGSAMLHRDNRWYAPLDWLESMRG